MRTATQPLRIAIVGAGQIGSTFAFQLSRQGGHDVTVIARPGSDRLTQLRRDAAIVKVTAIARTSAFWMLWTSKRRMTW